METRASRKVKQPFPTKTSITESAVETKEMSRYSSVDTPTQRLHFLVGLLEVPIPQTTGYEGKSTLELGPSVSIGLCDSSKAFDSTNGVFDDDANPSP
jgi:hypothetical protein